MTEAKITQTSPKEQFEQALTAAMFLFFEQTGMQIKSIELFWQNMHSNAYRKFDSVLLGMTIKAE